MSSWLHRRRRPLVAVILTVLACASCAAKQQATRAQVVRHAAPCPPEAPAPPVLPLQRPVHSMVEFWLARTAAADSVLLDAAAITEHNQQVAALTHEGWLAGRWNLLQRSADRQAIAAHLQLQIKRLREAISKGKRVLADGSLPWDLAAQFERSMRASKPADEIRVAHEGTPIRCYPTNAAIYDAPWQLPFDLMQCSQLRFGEAVRVLRKGSDFWYVWTSYTEGWVNPGALTPALTLEQAKQVLQAEHFAVIRRDRTPVRFDDTPSRTLGMGRLGGRLPLAVVSAAQILGGTRRFKILAPTSSGMKTASIRTEDVWIGHPPLTRERLLRAAFSLLDTPYGWGGTGGNRDCSRLLMDVFALFGLTLPRNSWQQSNAGTRRIDVGELTEAAKRETIEKAARDNIVLLYLPGHIALYLGRDGDHLFALHQFSGYQSVCAGGGLTMNRVNRTTVTALELGRGTKRRAFIERITRLVLFGPGLPEAGEVK